MMKKKNAIKFLATMLLAVTLCTQSILASETTQLDLSNVQLVRNGVAGFVIREDGSLWSWAETLFMGSYQVGRPIKQWTAENGVTYSEDVFINDEKVSWDVYVQTALKAMDDISAVSAGDGHILAVKKDGTLWGWGTNGQGQLGVEIKQGEYYSGNYQYAPIKIMDNIASAVAAGNRSYAVKVDGSLWVWGSGGAIMGGMENITTPRKIADNVASVSASSGMIMIIKLDDSLWTIGGITGDGTRNYSTTPVKVIDDAASAFAPIDNGPCMVIKKDGSLWAWGENRNGQVGNGTKSLQAVLSPVKVLDNVADVYSDSGHTLALKTDGSLWSWGNNFLGNLGDGTEIPRYEPAKIMDDVSSIVNTGITATNIALKKDGTLWTWGWNVEGCLGDGTEEDRFSPVKILDDVVAMTSSSFGGTAVKNDGTVWTWGNGLGNGTTKESLVPVKILDPIAQ